MHFLIFKHALANGGYAGDNLANSIKFLIQTEVEMVKRSKSYTFSVIPKRWIIGVPLGSLTSVTDF